MWFFTEEEKELKRLARTFAQDEFGPKASFHDKEESFNIQSFRKLGEVGLLGITADPCYGGAGLGALAATIVMEELGKVCASSALSCLAHSILCVNNISQNASDEQKQKYLPKLISGEHIGCMGMSEPEFGSDALGLQTKAQKKGPHCYSLNGSKMWITNAQYSDIAYVYARTGEGRKGISTFIVEKNTPGFSVGKNIHKMGMKASPTGELIFINAEVPVENRIGEEGDSYLHLLKNLEIERITISGISLGIASACLEQCIAYSTQRKQFGKIIGKFQLVQKMLAEMSAETAMMRAYLYNEAKEFDLGVKGAKNAAQVKLVLPKMATKIALDAVQLHGGYGYSQEFPLERYLRDAKLMEIGAGTNEIMIKIIGESILKQEGVVEKK